MSRAPVPDGSTTASCRVHDALSAALEPLRTSPETGVCVGLSGGLDSSVLLHALTRLAAFPVRAIHVNHQLHPQASEWVRHCEQFCAALGIELTIRSVKVATADGEGLEAAARRVRYQAIAGTLRPGEALLTAHHRDDQAETFLLNLMRGSGVTGLGGIPRESRVEGCRVLRPLLDLPRDVLLDYARREGIGWVDDPSNTNPQLDRNFLRHHVLPLLASRWPAVSASVARSARLCAEAADLTAALAVQDLRRVSRQGRLSVTALRELAEPRQRNLVRHWCRQGVGCAPPAQRLSEGLAQLLNAAEDRQPLLAWEGGEIRRYRSALYLLPAGALAGAASGTFTLPARPGASVSLGDGLGYLKLVRSRGRGLSPARLGPDLSVRFRVGGERLRPAGSAHTRDLKTLFQEHGIVPWMRDRIPLLYSGETLVAVAHLWVAADFAARGDEPGLRVRWDDHPALD